MQDFIEGKQRATTKPKLLTGNDRTSHAQLELASALLRAVGMSEVVDDEDLLLTVGQMILASYGYKVLTANSGAKAVEILSKNDPPVQLLITDLVMPLMSGRELMEQARKLSPGLRIICTSGYAWPVSREEDPSYLQKPFTSRELLAKAKQLLGSAPAVD